MRRFVFLLLCCLLFCLPALGEEFEVVPSETEPGVYYMRAKFAGYPQYELGQPWVRRDGELDAPLPQTLHDFLWEMCPAGENMAYVDNAYPSQRLNLRVRPDQASMTLGKYYSGTPVEILDYPNEVWAHVRIGSREGYMKRAYLALCDLSVISYSNRVIQITPGTQAILRAQPRGDAQVLGRYDSNTSVTVLESMVDGWWDGDESMEWSYVRIGEQEGYMVSYLLRPGAYAVAAPPIVTINNTSGTGLNLRATPESKGKIIRLIENGERVTVLGITENYLHVRSGADTGFIQNRSTVPALDYHSSETKPAFEPFEAIIRDDTCSINYPRLYNGSETNICGMYVKGRQVTVYGIYGLFAQISHPILDSAEYVYTEDLLNPSTRDLTQRFIANCPQFSYQQLLPEIAACFDKEDAQCIFALPRGLDRKDAAFLPVACIKEQSCTLAILQKMPDGQWQKCCENVQALVLMPERIQSINDFYFMPPSQYYDQPLPGSLSCICELIYEGDNYLLQVQYETSDLYPSGLRLYSVTIAMPRETKSKYVPNVKYDHLTFAVTKENTIQYHYALQEETSGWFNTQPVPSSALDAAACSLTDIINAVSHWGRAQ